MGQGFRNRFAVGVVTVLATTVLTGFNLSSSSAATNAPTIQSSESITTDTTSGVTKVYLNTFRPNTRVDFKITWNDQTPISLTSNGETVKINSGQSLQFSLVGGPLLSQSSIGKPVKDFSDATGASVIQVFATPPDFPKLSFSGDSALFAKREILSTPVVAQGSYAMDTIGTSIKYFIKSPNNLIGFRKLTDSTSTALPGGTPEYAYLSQKDFSVSATSPGTWILLNSDFSRIGTLGLIKTKFGMIYSDGHDITTSKTGNPVVITTPTRNVSSSWLKRQYKLPVLDCDIAEVKNGYATNQFSFWDWAVAHKSVSEPILDGMPLYNDPQNPEFSPIDICHANSIEYNKALNEYLVSLRSPSLLLVLSSDLKTVEQIIYTDTSLQHFARFKTSTEITALGNYPTASQSQYLDFKLVGTKWNLTKAVLPVSVKFCGNLNLIDATHIWVGGGCGSPEPNVLGLLYEVKAGAVTEVGRATFDSFNYSYRADVI